MSSIVKLCRRCDEAFAKTFDLCPNCGSVLQAFRLQAITKAPTRSSDADIADYSVTVIPESNVATRNLLFAGALISLVLTLLTATVVNLFGKDLELGSIDSDVFNAVLVDSIPEPPELAPEVKKDSGKGGGGGGNEDPIPASKGDRAPMRTDPQFAPSVTMDRLTNPTIPIQMAIKGPINEKLDTTRYGLKLGGDELSDEPGLNGGQGPGRDRGQGPGDGPGAGPGQKGGIGGGPEGGIPKNANEEDAPRDGITTALRIISKPRPGFTELARQNGIQGDIILRVTFNANGTIGNVTVVKGLPDGLTERAIAAAKQITFEPVMVNGRAQSVTKQIEYGFYIY